MDLSKIDFGRYDAESDKRLNDYFVETGAVAQATSGKKLVLGRKGSGKTALFRHLVDNLPTTVVDLDLNEYVFAYHAELQEKGMSEDRAYLTAWKILIYSSIVAKLRDSLDRRTRKSVDAVMGRLLGGGDSGKISQIFAWITRVKRLDLPFLEGVAGLGGVELEDRPDEEAALSAATARAVGDLESLLAPVLDATPVTVLIDRVDDAWDGSAARKRLISGALRATRDINLRFHKSGPAAVILFLRTDLWSEVSFNDRNKMSQDIIYLEWRDPDLVDVINKRIQASLDDASVGWRDVFFDGEMRQRMKSSTYITKRTMGRPRDIVAFAALSLEVAQNEGHSVIEADDIYEAEASYSRHVLDELKDEIEFHVDDFGKVLGTLTAIGRRSFRSDDWVDRATQQGLSEESAMRALNQLFEASVVGNLETGGEGGGSRSKYRYQNKNIQPTSDSLMQVHLALVKELGIKDS